MGGLKGLYDRVISLIKADTVLETYEPVNTDIIAVYDYSTASETTDGQKIATKKYVPITSVGTGPQGSYNLANPTIPLGGITAGVNGGISTPNIQGMTWQQVVQALLAPYQSPVISSFTINGQATTVEVGSTITSPKTFTIVYSNAINVAPNTFEISNTASGTILIPSAVPASGAATPSITFPPVTQTTDTSVTWTAKIQNTQGANITRNTSVDWRYKIYVGANINTTLTEAQIKALTVNTSLTATSVRTYTFSSTYSPPQYLYFCFPNSVNFTMPAAIKLSGNDVPLETSAPYTNVQNGLNYALVNVTNSFGASIQYRVYRTFQQLSGNGAAIIIS